MATFIMLTRLSHQALQSPSSLISLSHEVMQRIRSDCKGVECKASYVILGPADYLDIFTAPDLETATKVATIIRTFGHATTEIWGATEWEKFTEIARHMAPAALVAAQTAGAVMVPQPDAEGDRGPALRSSMTRSRAPSKPGAGQTPSIFTSARKACQVACPRSGKIATRPTNSVASPSTM